MNVLLLFFPLFTLSNAFELVILHTNDVHARMDETNKYGAACSTRDKETGNCYGGVARRQTVIKQERAAHDNVLLLDAGDQFQGTTWFSFYEGLATAHFMNLLEYDAMALGNHEFDTGVTGLQTFLGNVSFPILSSNTLLLNGASPPGIQRSVVLEVGQRKVGVVGYITADTKNMVDPSGVESVKFTDAIQAVQQEVDAFSNYADGPVDIIIVLGHGGLQFDEILAQKISGVDLVIGGHSHSFLWTGDPPSNNAPLGDYPIVVQQSSGKSVPVVQAYSYGKYLGKIQLDFDANGELVKWTGMPILLNSSIAENPDLSDEILKWSRPLEEFRNKETGFSYVDLDGDRDQCRMRECNMGNLFCDAMVQQNLRTGKPRPGQWATSAIGIWNAGGIRSSIGPGPITRSQVIEVFPFRNEISRVLFAGSTVFKILEHAVSEYDITAFDPPGKFLQLSGIRVAYNLSAPVGSRVHRVQTLCSHCLVPVFQELDLQQNYSVLVSSFMVNGGDGYSVIKEEMFSIEPLGYVGADIVEAYLSAFSPVIIGLDDRISFLGNESFIPPVSPYEHCVDCTDCEPCTTHTEPCSTNEGVAIKFTFLLLAVLGLLQLEL